MSLISSCSFDMSTDFAKIDVREDVDPRKASSVVEMNIYLFSNARSYSNLRRTCVRQRNSKTMVKRCSPRKADGL